MKASEFLFKITGSSSDGEKALDQFGKKVKDTTDSAGSDFAGFADDATGSIEELLGLTALGAGAGLSLGSAIGGGITQGLELETAQSMITASLGLTAEESEVIGSVAGELYSNAFGDSIEGVNAAVEDVVSSIGGMRDASASALEDMTEKALNFNTAFGMDTARSTQVVGQLLKTGLVSDADEAFDLLTATMQKVPKNVREDVMDAADEYGPFFSSLGFSGSEAFGLLAAGAEKGMYGIDKTGDALKEFSTLVSTDLTRAQPVIESLGLNYGDMSNALLAGGDTARDAFFTIVKGLQDIQDPSEQARASIALFGTPLEDLNTSEIPEFLTGMQDAKYALGDVTGAAEKMGDTLNGTTAVGWTELSRQWENITNQVGQFLLPILTTVTDWLSENPDILAAVAAGLGAAAVAVAVLTAATWAMNTAFYANPITWIILAIAALVAVIVWLALNWEEVWTAVSTFFVDVWNNIVSFATDVWNNFLLGMQIIGTAIADWWNGLWSSITQFFVDTWNNIVSFVSYVGAVFVLGWQAIGIAIADWWNGLWSGITQFFVDTWNNILAVVGGIGDFFAQAFGVISDIVGGAFEAVLNGIKWYVNLIIDAVNTIIDGINTVVGTAGAVIGLELKIPNVPRLAGGGVTTGETLAVIGDNPGGREVVQPLESLRQDRRADIAAALTAAGGSSAGRDLPPINLTVNTQPGMDGVTAGMSGARRVAGVIARAK